jgi:biotin carboxyl carrier protein
MGLSPRRVNAELKKQLAKAGVKNPHQNKPQNVLTNREYRLIPTKRLTARLGISQYDVKAPLTTKEIVVSEVRLVLAQHIGAPSQPIVKVGDQVAKGDLIAVIPEGAAVGANLHASISGRIVTVDASIGIRAV